MIAERIRLIREDKKLSQAKFGELLGVNRDIIKNRESGAVEPDNLFINALVTKLDANEHWLRTGEGVMYNTADEKIQFTRAVADALEDDREDVRELVMEALQLEPEEAKALKIFLRTIKKKQSE